MSEEKRIQEPKRTVEFTGIGILIGVMIGGVNFGIIGAMMGAVLGPLLVSTGIQLQVKDLKIKGKYHPFKGAMVVSYALAFIFTFAAIKLAPFLLTSESGFTAIIVLYVGPAFAGGIGALIPVWLSRERKLD